MSVLITLRSWTLPPTHTPFFLLFFSTGFPCTEWGGDEGQYKKAWRWLIEILPLICSEKCPAQRTLTPINPTTGCYRCSGSTCVCACVYLGSCMCVRVAWWCGRQRHLRAQCRAPAPAQSIGSLSLPPKLGRRQVHFRATGQIDSSAFIFFRRRSGSCLEAGKGAIRWWDTQTGERQGERLCTRVR